MKAIFLPILAALLLCGCVLPRQKAPQAPARKEAAARLSEEDLKKVERLYYKAVVAYNDNDMELAQKRLDEISAIAPAYGPSAELREKIRNIRGAVPAGGQK